MGPKEEAKMCCHFKSEDSHTRGRHLASQALKAVSYLEEFK